MQLSAHKHYAYTIISVYPVNPKHLYNIYTMLDQRRRRWADVVWGMVRKLISISHHEHNHQNYTRVRPHTRNAASKRVCASKFLIAMQ